mmetsp:Transcript_14733/g.58949  ORF Transcript_14733/g.58949 Transcript_14733/m.58949 type:complete len:331 (+) Transcript_14733:1214-2206(+)
MCCSTPAAAWRARSVSRFAGSRIRTHAGMPRALTMSGRFSRGRRATRHSAVAAASLTRCEAAAMSTTRRGTPPASATARAAGSPSSVSISSIALRRSTAARPRVSSSKTVESRCTVPPMPGNRASKARPRASNIEWSASSEDDESGVSTSAAAAADGCSDRRCGTPGELRRSAHARPRSSSHSAMTSLSTRFGAYSRRTPCSSFVSGSTVGWRSSQCISAARSNERPDCVKRNTGSSMTSSVMGHLNWSGIWTASSVDDDDDDSGAAFRARGRCCCSGALLLLLLLFCGAVASSSLNETTRRSTRGGACEARSSRRHAANTSAASGSSVA